MSFRKPGIQFNVAKTMPPLKHKTGGTFDVNTSGVINWLIAQPRIRQHVFDVASLSGLIVYDQASGTWQGTDYKPVGIVF